MFRRNSSFKPRRGIVFAVRRSAVLWWVLTAVMAVLTASLVGSAVGRATRGAAAWGSDRLVWVVQQPVAAGDVLTNASVRRTRLPRGVVPAGALDGARSPVGDATRVTVAIGEVVLAARLARHGARGVAAMVPAGYRALALPNDEHTPELAPGDRVDVIATFDVGDDLAVAAAPEPSITVAAGAEVLAVAARTVTVAVPEDDAPRVALALAKGAVTLALRGGFADGPMTVDPPSVN
ncbi:MAG TPA: Flp pilus assembly protein CpaB [Acidimicrobiales bacterium]|nr:Flp pilus assembly protein CpaB [Acidimicrobiales bacterium]